MAIDYLMPLYAIPTHLTEEERELLYVLSTGLTVNFSIVVEIGSYLGASTCFLAAGVQHRQGNVYAVDTWTNRAMSEGTRDTYQEFLNNTEDYSEIIVPLRGLSTNVAETFEKHIDLLFIDGDHSYQGVRADLEAWLPKVKEGGIIVFHDFNWAAGVQQAVREFVFPIQTEMGHCQDSIYWTRIGSAAQQCAAFAATIIVPTAGSSNYFRETLKSLTEQDTSLEYEIVIIDNKPDRNIREIVDGYPSQEKVNISYAREPMPGLLAGRHKGAELARGEILIYVDDDIIASKGWLQTIMDTFEDPDVQLVGGRNLPSYEAEPPEWIDAFWHIHEHGTWCDYLSLLDFGDERQVIEPTYVWGLNFAIRKQALIALGGFHPDGMPWELRRYRGDGETGLAMKAKALQLKAVYQPQALVYHRVPASRLTVEYFERRAFLQGISDSYSSLRRSATLDQVTSNTNGWNWKTPLRKLKNNLIHLYSKWKEPSGKIKAQIRRAYEAGYAYHQNEVSNDPILLEWVLKEAYWDYQLPHDWSIQKRLSSQ